MWNSGEGVRYGGWGGGGGGGNSGNILFTKNWMRQETPKSA